MPAESGAIAAQGEAARLYAEREQRLRDTIALQVPDRVPVVYMATFWHATAAGRTVRDVMYDYDLAARLMRQVVLELQPDAVGPAFSITALGPVLDLLDYRQLKWPGHGVADHCSYQYIDRENMTAAEYDLFLDDPTYFWLSRYLPRVAGAFAPLAKMPHFPSVQHTSLISAMSAFADPDLNQAFARLGQVGLEAQRMVERDAALEAELTALGFPSVVSGTSTAPFDYFADFLRGSKGIMLDMFRRKQKLLTAMERVIPILIRSAVTVGTYGRGNIILMPMHWGLDGFMSLEQFKTFFWPQLRQVLVGMIEGGVVPLVFWEGDCTSRLETMADIPPGKVIYAFERTDIFRAKEVLGGIACVQGNVPSSLLTTGTPDDVAAYCRRLIEGVGKGGGFILDGSAGIPDEARPENVKAMFRSVYEYGRY